MSKVRLAVRGDDREFTLAVGETILEAAMAQGLPLDHACGGVCACSTCHVKIKQGAAAFSEASEDELDQLDEARDVGLDSRLGCQAKLLRAPEGGVVEIAVPTWNVNAVREGAGH
ncbi:MAG: 2Fe-2S iron-sulfur cluster binding domain-containing protein [Planctomycetes bacterium]|nr:2Fe-2S iron-sulfur cluster binding domain-containing protein [Planctomycetota bacterium]MCB9885086.1 2Fe-2S iron-sulfur cluster binding domain-containing protein [Planctomycetota bacterium]